MKFAVENPALEQDPFESMFREDYGRLNKLESLADSISPCSSDANRGTSARRIVQC